MDLDQRDGKLRVHYGDRLVTLMREVRQLSALGFAVPAKIQQTASVANKFYRHGMILKQVSYSDTVTSYCFDTELISTPVPTVLHKLVRFFRMS